MRAAFCDPDFHFARVAPREDGEVRTAGYDTEERGGVAFEVYGLFGARDGVGFAVFAVESAEGVFVDCFVDYGCEGVVACAGEIGGGDVGGMQLDA